MAKKKFHALNVEVFNKPIIQIYSENLENELGKKINFDLTRYLKGKSSEAKLVVGKSGSNYIAKFESLKILPFYIKRSVRKGTSYVEDSFVVKVKDAYLRIKPFLLTRKKVHRSVRKSLRENAKSFVEKLLREKTREEVFRLIISLELQRIMNKKLRKTYPLAFCDIRNIEVLNKKVENFEEKTEKKEKISVEKIKESEDEVEDEKIEETEEKIEEKDEEKKEKKTRKKKENTEEKKEKKTKKPKKE